MLPWFWRGFISAALTSVLGLLCVFGLGGAGPDYSGCFACAYLDTGRVGPQAEERMREMEEGFQRQMRSMEESAEERVARAKAMSGELSTAGRPSMEGAQVGSARGALDCGLCALLLYWFVCGCAFPLPSREVVRGVLVWLALRGGGTVGGGLRGAEICDILMGFCALACLLAMFK